MRVKVAVCACGAIFYETDMEEISKHITEYSSTAHYWRYVADITISQELPCRPNEESSSTV